MMNFLDTSPKNLVLHGFAWLASLVLLLLLVRTRHELVSVEESQSEKISQLEDILSQLHERLQSAEQTSFLIPTIDQNLANKDVVQAQLTNRIDEMNNQIGQMNDRLNQLERIEAQLYDLHRRQPTEKWLSKRTTKVDELTDFNHMMAWSDQLFIDSQNAELLGNDPGRLARYKNTPEFAIWNVPGIAMFEIVSYHWPDLPVNEIAIYASPDNEKYTLVEPASVTTDKPSFRYRWMTMTASFDLPLGSNYVKIEFPTDVKLEDSPWTPQVGRIIMADKLANHAAPEEEELAKISQRGVSWFFFVFLSLLVSVASICVYHLTFFGGGFGYRILSSIRSWRGTNGYKQG